MESKLIKVSIHNDTRYEFWKNDKISWTQAKSEAENLKMEYSECECVRGRLADIKDCCENNFIRDMVNGEVQGVFLGGKQFSDDEPAGHWGWSHSNKLFWNNGPVKCRFYNWLRSIKPRQPDNSSGNDNSLIMITNDELWVNGDGEANGFWADLPDVQEGDNLNEDGTNKYVQGYIVKFPRCHHKEKDHGAIYKVCEYIQKSDIYNDLIEKLYKCLSYGK